MKLSYALSDEYAENLNQCYELWYYIWASPNKNDVGSESNSEEVWENGHVKIKMDKNGFHKAFTLRLILLAH